MAEHPSSDQPDKEGSLWDALGMTSPFAPHEMDDRSVSDEEVRRKVAALLAGTLPAYARQEVNDMIGTFPRWFNAFMAETARRAREHGMPE